MSVSSVTNSSQLLSLLQQQTAAQQQQSASSGTGTAAASGFGSSYTLSVGQQQTAGSLLGYGALGSLVSGANSALNAMDRDNPATTASLGNGQKMMQTYGIDVQQLAQAQVLTSGGYADPSQVIGTGTLTLQGGTYDAGTDSFSPTGNSIPLTITDGSLTGIAQAVNTANIGLSARVTTGSDGLSHLELTGPTGSDCAFSLSGIPGLAYDPTTPSFTGMEATQTAQDAHYSVNGGPTQTSPVNDNVPVADGLTTTLSATGSTTLSVPFGQTQAVGAANALVKAINGLVSGLGQMTGSGGELAGDTGVASKLAKALDQVAGQTFSGTGQFSSLSDLGITVQSDGSLAVDQTTFQKAYASDPTGTRTLLDQASKAMQQVLGGTQGAGDQIKSAMQGYVQQMMASMPSLASMLGQDQSGSSQSSSDPFAQMSQSQSQSQSSQMNAVMSALQSSPSLVNTLNQTSQGQALLASLGLNSDGTQAASGTSASSASGTSASSAASSSSLAQALAALQGTTA